MVVFRVPQHSEQVAVLVLVLLALRVLPCVALRWLSGFAFVPCVPVGLSIRVVAVLMCPSSSILPLALGDPSATRSACDPLATRLRPHPLDIKNGEEGRLRAGEEGSHVGHVPS